MYLIPYPRWKSSTYTGEALAGGKVYTYEAGTTTPLPTYTDYTGLIANANPVILDSNGEANIWFSSAAYKIILNDSNGNVQWSVDNIYPVNYQVVSVSQYAADPSGSADSTTAFNDAIAAVASTGGAVFVPRGSYKTTSTIVRPANVRIIGEGSECTIINPTGNFAIFSCIGSSTNILNGGGIEGLCIIGTWGANNSNTLSIGISESWTNRSIHRDLNIRGCYIGIYGNQGLFQDVWDNIQVNGAGTQQNYIGFYLDALPSTLPSGTDNAVKAVNCTAQNCSYAGFRLINPNGSQFTNCEAENGQYGWFIGDSTSGNYPIEFLHISNCLGDSAGYGWVIQQGSNAVADTDIQISNIWAGNCTTGIYMDGCLGITVSNIQSNGHTGSGLIINNCAQCVVAIGSLKGNNTASTGSIGDIIISGGSYNTVTKITSNMANSSSASLLESSGTNNNIIEGNTVFQSMTLIGAGTRAYNNTGYNPLGYTGPTTVGSSPATITAGQSQETHYIKQSATNTATVTVGGGKNIGTLTAGTTLVVTLDPAGAYQVTWTTTAPTYVKYVH